MFFVSERLPNQLSSCTTLVDVLRRRAVEQSEGEAYVFLDRGEVDGTRWSYGQLFERVRAIAACLQAIGAFGQRVLLLYPPGLEFVAAFLGCLFAGAIAVPTSPPRKRQASSRLQGIAADAGAAMLLTTSDYRARMQPELAQVSPLEDVQWVATDAIDVAIASDAQQVQLSPDDLAFLQYTSGSTGTPKGVAVSHGNLMHNSAAIHACFRHDASSRGVIWLPPYHDMGLIGGVLQPLYGGFPVTLMSAVDFLQKPMRWLQAIARYGATTSGGPNFAFDLCVKRFQPELHPDLDLSSWEVAFTGAEPVRAETLDRFSRAFAPYGFSRKAFYPCYGMAETTLIVSGGDKAIAPTIEHVDTQALADSQIVQRHYAHEAGSQAVVSCGSSLPDQAIRIIDPQTLLPCGDNRVGEIWVAGPSVARGYWNQPQETRSTFENYLPESGYLPFLRTGDLGFIHNGELFVTGRIKDVIIIRGQNYYPQDIELTVEKSHPALRSHSGAAFSIEVANSEQLAVVHEVERTHLKKLNVPVAIADIRQSVTAKHQLQTCAIALVKPGSIPKTSSGKIRRRACKAALLAGDLGGLIYADGPDGVVPPPNKVLSN